jgi:hypothetical protein
LVVTILIYGAVYQPHQIHTAVSSATLNGLALTVFLLRKTCSFKHYISKNNLHIYSLGYDIVTSLILFYDIGFARNQAPNFY